MKIIEKWENISQKQKILYGIIGGYLLGFLQWNLFNLYALYRAGSSNSLSLIIYVGTIFGLIYAILFTLSAFLYLKHKKLSLFIFKTTLLVFVLITILLFVSLNLIFKPIKDI